MMLTFLLVLVGAVAADEAQLVVPLTVESGRVAGVPATSPGAFQVAPLVLGSAVRMVPFQAFGVPQARSGAGGEDERIVQLENKRAGVTCTMRIITVKPTIDRGILAPTSVPQPDPIVRNSLSPCVE